MVELGGEGSVINGATPSCFDSATNYKNIAERKVMKAKWSQNLPFLLKGWLDFEFFDLHKQVNCE